VTGIQIYSLGSIITKCSGDYITTETFLRLKSSEETGADPEEIGSMGGSALEISS
jgi:hypothetical protein